MQKWQRGPGILTSARSPRLILSFWFLISGTQETVELFAKFEKLASVLLHGDAGAEFLNVFTESRVHAREVLQ
jgi:hypothetical protein